MRLTLPRYRAETTAGGVPAASARDSLARQIRAATIAALSLGSSHPLSPKELASTDLVVQGRVAVARTPWR
ncbi:hypothetical protein G6F59_018262 [Rhizopus arrhizus]|nr:hypothetical protein G6F59_018262 [Rhizopus arrhizus]